MGTAGVCDGTAVRLACGGPLRCPVGAASPCGLERDVVVKASVEPIGYCAVLSHIAILVRRSVEIPRHAAAASRRGPDISAPWQVGLCCVGLLL